MAAVVALTDTEARASELITTTQSFVAVADAYVSSTSADENFGSESVLHIDGSNLSSSHLAKSFVRFEVEGLSGAVVSAVVRLYSVKGDSAGFEARDAVGSWYEETITWSNAPTSDSDVIASSGWFDSGSWTALDVTSAVRGDGSVTFALWSTSPTPMAVASREAGVSVAPMLEVTTTPLAPSNEAPPSILGTAQEGATLTAALGAWAGPLPVSYSYEWRRCDPGGEDCVSIGDARGGTYTLTASDVGSTLRVTVAASNAGGQSTATSAPTGVVTPATPFPAALGSSLPARLPESTGTVFYVTTSGSDSSPGTQAQPWRTIQRAASTLTAGQKALVAPGNYSEDVSVTRDLVGPQPATIEALDPANMPVVLGSLRPQNAAAYWRFSNLKLDGTASGHEYGIKVTGNGTATVPHHLEFYGMEVYNVDSGLPQPQGISVQGGTGSTVPHDLHFYNNLVHHIGGPSASQNQTHSFYFGQCEDMVVANNVSRDSRGWGFRMGSAESNVKGMRNSILVNNTVVRSSAGGGFTLYEEGSGAPPHYLSAGNRFYNNIVSDVQGLRAYSSWFLSQVSGPADVLNLWDKNLAYLVGALSYNGDGAHVSSTFVSQPINADPKFVNKAGNDFHLQAGSPAIGAGLPDYTPPFDFDGNPRTTADLGAFRG